MHPMTGQALALQSVVGAWRVGAPPVSREQDRRQSISIVATCWNTTRFSLVTIFLPAATCRGWPRVHDLGFLCHTTVF